MSGNVRTRVHYFFSGLLVVFFGALASYIGFAFVGVQLFGEVEFEKVIFLIGSVSVVFGPALTVVGIRLLTNKPNRHGSFISPLMLRAFAVFYAIFGGFSCWLVYEQNILISVVAAVFYILVTHQAFYLANRRESVYQAEQAGSMRMVKRTRQIRDTKLSRFLWRWFIGPW